jgi:hypothetical protein
MSTGFARRRHQCCLERDYSGKPCAPATADRLEALPDIPTVGESIPGYEASLRHGIGARASAPGHHCADQCRTPRPQHEGAALRLGRDRAAGSPSDSRKLIATATL